MARDAFRSALALMLLLEASCTFYTGPPAGVGQVGTPVGTPPPGIELDGGPEPKGAWQNVTHNLAGLKSSCNNLALLAAHPSADFLVVSVIGRGFWASTDGAHSWSALGQGALSTKDQNNATTFLFDPDDQALFWESGINGPAGIFKTTDSGKHFQTVGTPTPVEGLSVDFGDRDRQTILAGGHNEQQTMYLSTDAGLSFERVGDSIPVEADASTFPLIIDPSTFLVGCPASVGNGALTGIYRTEDAGTSWQLASRLGGTAAPLVASDRSIYWAGPNGGGIVKSTDDGKTFVEQVGPGFLQSFTPVELPDGRLAAVSLHHIVVSNDDGGSWHFVTPMFPYAPNGFVYSAAEKAFFIWHSTCAGLAADGSLPVPRDAIERFDYDYAAKGS
jgi:hypothetical protein